MDYPTFSGDIIPAPQLPAAPPENYDQPPAPTLLEEYRDENPQAKEVNDLVLARQLYDQGEHQKDESFPAFATRIGVTQDSFGTFANNALETMALHLDRPIEAAASGVGGLFSGEGFMPAFRQKLQEMSDASDIGSYQNPKSSFGGNAVGTTADVLRFGPAFRAAADAIPGVSRLAASGPTGDMAAKLSFSNIANELAQLLPYEAARNDGASVGERIGDTALKGVALPAAEGTGGAVLGTGVSKTLGALAPLVEALGEGVVNKTEQLARYPRSVYTKALQKLSEGWTSEGPTPAQRAFEVDKNFYNSQLDNGTSVPQGKKIIADLVQRPGNPSHVMDAGDAAANDLGVKTPTQHFEDIKKQYGLSSNDTPESLAYDAKTSGSEGSRFTSMAMERPIEELNTIDPSGKLAQQYIANVFKDIIPDRLQGPFDPGASFERNLISGALSDKGKLIKAPLSLPGRIVAGAYERAGGGPATTLPGVLPVAKRLTEK